MTADGMTKEAVGKALTNATIAKRKVSKYEHRHDHGRLNKKQRAQQSIAASTNTHFDGSDERHLPASKLDQRTCSFCKKAKHFALKCPTLLQHSDEDLGEIGIINSWDQGARGLDQLYFKRSVLSGGRGCSCGPCRHGYRRESRDDHRGSWGW